MPEKSLIKNEYRCFLLFLISNAKMGDAANLLI